MGWRPQEEEWEKLVKENLDWTDRQSLEAGADAILEALKKSGVLMENYNPTNRTVTETAAFLNQCKDGVLVFIPDKEEKDGRERT